jgi:hypothetical protein
MPSDGRYVNEILRLTLDGSIDWQATGDCAFAATVGGSTIDISGDAGSSWATFLGRDTRSASMRGADRSNLLLMFAVLQQRVLAA